MADSIYTTGGTVQAGGGIYLSRKADDELLQLCREGQFAYVLTSRQMGKSSLMVQTALRLEDEGITSVIIDLTKIGTNVTPEQWYLGLLTEIDESLMLDTDIFDWWEENNHLGVTQRLTRFFEEILLSEVEERIVLFVDEIDTTLSLEFTDDFFIAIRYFYTARAQKPKLKQISFVLLGVASPNELIQDPKRTPFNIGTQIDLTDFSKEELHPLAKGLDLKSTTEAQVINEVVFWTSGHPYLTQYLFQKILDDAQAPYSNNQIAEIVADSFFSSNEKQDSNLSFVSDMIVNRSMDKWMTLTEYKQILNGKNVDDDKRSLIKNHLKLSGILVNRHGKLQIRNEIYKAVFDNKWIVRQLSRIRPSTRTVVGSSLLTAIVIIVLKSLGTFMPLELWAYDRIINLQPDLGPDPRILLVGINEQDLNNQQRGSPSDQSIADAIDIIQSHNPTTIALDLHRNIPQGEGQEDLVRSLAADNIIGITYLGNTPTESISPPPGLNSEQAGFSNMPLDPDSEIRRNLFFASLDDISAAEVYTSFGLLVALHYLYKRHNLKALASTHDNEVMAIGNVDFKRMDANFGGYQAIDAAGYQILLNYRSPNQVARQVSLTDILTNTVDPKLIKDKIVLVGITAYISQDKFFTPYTTRRDGYQMSGVEIQAHMISQFLSSVLDDRPLPSSLSEEHEAIYIFLLTIAGGCLTQYIFFRKTYMICFIAGFALSLIVLAHTLYWTIWIYWVPIASPAIGFCMVGIVMAIWMRTEKLMLVTSSER